MTGDAARIHDSSEGLHRERLFSEWDHRLRDKSRPQDNRLRDKLGRPQDIRRCVALARRQLLLYGLLFVLQPVRNPRRRRRPRNGYFLFEWI
jgi:hypothetical protein